MAQCDWSSDVCSSDLVFVVCAPGGECRGGRGAHHRNHLPGRHEPPGLLESAHGHERAKGRVHHRDDEYGKRACRHRGAGRDRLCGHVVWLDGRPRARVGPCLALRNSHVPHVAETHIKTAQDVKILVVTQEFKVFKKSFSSMKTFCLWLPRVITW